ncbi:MAG: hypothetical protein ACREXJ_16670, partial [Gammaproteobacteria bacterium]
MNSAQSWSRDRVDETFPDAAIDGSIRWGWIESLIGVSDLVGNWAIRTHIEARGYSRRAAQCIMHDYAMPAARGVQHTRT